VGHNLDGTVLAVQGPPGSGKTTTGAELIRSLLDAKLTVGVTALSHAVIGNLLKEVGRPALQKCDADNACGAPGVDATNDNADVDAAIADGGYRLIGGSAWLWSREEMADSVDVLVVDEAGQFSLANAVAVSQSARGLVLLGDPQQLAQPSQAEHPDGAGVSALQHLIQGHATIPPDLGVFLDRSWRMHPDVCRVVSTLMYDGRLRSAHGRERQRVIGAGMLDGTGVRWLSVDHVGNQSASTEEAQSVAKLVDQLYLGCRWKDPEGEEHVLGLGDILVVAPYNAHVGRLRKYLPAGVQVGTVDKFQGQQAPVVIYSMASSSAEDAPRGTSFLYDLNRLNVAISRAKCLAVVVASPSLLDAAVSSPENLRRVNGLLTVHEAASNSSH
jgi:uncharacterized protein